MIVQVVKFKSGLTDEEARRIMEDRAPLFRALPGLLQKHYFREPATGELGGIYLWDSEESLRAFRESDLARTIPSAYAVVGQPRVETFEVLFPLREREGASGADRVVATASE
ncbi:MAG: YdhR family protein [Thermomicrobiales bacterium]